MGQRRDMFVRLFKVAVDPPMSSRSLVMAKRMKMGFKVDPCQNPACPIGLLLANGSENEDVISIRLMLKSRLSCTFIFCPGAEFMLQL